MAWNKRTYGRTRKIYKDNAKEKVTVQPEAEVNNDGLDDDFYNEDLLPEGSDNKEDDDDKDKSTADTEKGKSTSRSDEISDLEKRNVLKQQAKLEREMKKLDSSYNPTKNVKFTSDTSLPNVIEEEASSNKETEVNFVFNASLASDPGLPNSYDEVMEDLIAKSG